MEQWGSIVTEKRLGICQKEGSLAHKQPNDRFGFFRSRTLPAALSARAAARSARLLLLTFFFLGFLASPVCELLRESETEAYAVVPVSRAAVAAARNPTVSRIVVPTAAT